MKQLPRIFKYDDVKDLYPNVKNYYAFVCRALKRNQIKQIKKGLYALIDPSLGEIYANRFQIASSLFQDAYFSYHEAIEYYGLANQSFASHFNYLTHVSVRNVDFEETIYHSKKSTNDLEILNHMKENGVRVVSLERAIIDSIDCPSLAGGLEEIESALSICPDLDIDKITKLLEHYDKSYLYQKVGYLFEKYFGDEYPEEFYEMCKKHVKKRITYFESKPRYSVYVPKWNLMVPKERELPDELV